MKSPTATTIGDPNEGIMSVELIAIPYTIRLDIECETCCRGSLVRLPDGVEASFNCADGLLVLLEGMGGRRWWQANRTQIEERFGVGPRVRHTA
ncbi:MAG: hypothetical protein IPO81_14705 [Kouleothrix sp.]|nr:hypothetical protein [Kouleothrix sp.]